MNKFMCLYFMFVSLQACAMDADLRLDIEQLLKHNAVENVALETFPVPYKKLNCLQSSLVYGTKIVHETLPLTSVLASSVALCTWTGDIIWALGGASALYSLGYFDWYSHERASIRISNQVAKRFAPQEYAKHLNLCKRIKGQEEKKQKDKETFKLFKEQRQIQVNNASEQQLRQEFNKQRKQKNNTTPKIAYI